MLGEIVVVNHNLIDMSRKALYRSIPSTGLIDGGLPERNDRNDGGHRSVFHCPLCFESFIANVGELERGTFWCCDKIVCLACKRKCGLRCPFCRTYGAQKMDEWQLLQRRWALRPESNGRNLPLENGPLMRELEREMVNLRRRGIDEIMSGRDPEDERYLDDGVWKVWRPNAILKRRRFGDKDAEMMALMANPDLDRSEFVEREMSMRSIVDPGDVIESFPEAMSINGRNFFRHVRVGGGNGPRVFFYPAEVLGDIQSGNMEVLLNMPAFINMFNNWRYGVSGDRVHSVRSTGNRLYELAIYENPALYDIGDIPSERSRRRPIIAFHGMFRDVNSGEYVEAVPIGSMVGVDPVVQEQQFNEQQMGDNEELVHNGEPLVEVAPGVHVPVGIWGPQHYLWEQYGNGNNIIDLTVEEANGAGVNGVINLLSSDDEDEASSAYTVSSVDDDDIGSDPGVFGFQNDDDYDDFMQYYNSVRK